VAFGHNASSFTTTGSSTTAVGHDAFLANTTGSNNVAMGTETLRLNTTGSNNTAVGYQAGYSTTTNDRCVFVGRQAGYTTTGVYNTFIGDQTGYFVTTGTNNAFFGFQSGINVTTGSKNTIIGNYNGNQGGLDIRTASNRIVLSDGDGNPRAHWDANGNLNNIAGSIRPAAAPSSVWGLDFAPATSSATYVVIANDATYDLAVGSGLVWLWDDAAIGNAQIYCYYGIVSVTNIYGALYTSTFNNAGTINVYYNGGTNTYRIQNKTGGSKSLYISTIRMRAGS
jgi:hypothetical protein